MNFPDPRDFQFADKWIQLRLAKPFFRTFHRQSFFPEHSQAKLPELYSTEINTISNSKITYRITLEAATRAKALLNRNDYKLQTPKQHMA
jgi:hypothetical protein